MGGFGSGRHGGRIKTEDCWSFDVNRLRREGRLLPGYQGSRRWSCIGKVVTRIGRLCEGQELVLIYLLRRADEEPEVIECLCP